MRKHCTVVCAMLSVAPMGNADNIYYCTQADNSVTLQQLPCTTAVEERVYVFPSSSRDAKTRGPAALPERERAVPQARRNKPERVRKTKPNPVGKRLTQCRKLWNRESDLRDTEREGYTASEGEQIRKQLRKIKRDKKLLRCSEFR